MDMMAPMMMNSQMGMMGMGQQQAGQPKQKAPMDPGQEMMKQGMAVIGQLLQGQIMQAGQSGVPVFELAKKLTEMAAQVSPNGGGGQDVPPYMMAGQNGQQYQQPNQGQQKPPEPPTGTPRDEEQNPMAGAQVNPNVPQQQPQGGQPGQFDWQSVPSAQALNQGGFPRVTSSASPFSTTGINQNGDIRVGLWGPGTAQLLQAQQAANAQPGSEIRKGIMTNGMTPPSQYEQGDLNLRQAALEGTAYANQVTALNNELSRLNESQKVYQSLMESKIKTRSWGRAALGGETRPMKELQNYIGEIEKQKAKVAEKLTKLQQPNQKEVPQKSDAGPFKVGETYNGAKILSVKKVS